jgi:hypothetical protein
MQCDGRVDVGEDMSEYTGQDNGTLKVTIREATNRLGVTEAAIRKRIQRGSLDKELGSDGRVYVYLDLSRDMSHPESQVDREALLEAKDDTIRILEEQLRLRGEEIQRRDVIISQLTQANAALAARVPELEASQEPPGGPQSAGVGSNSGDPARRRRRTGGPCEALVEEAL